MSILLQDVKCAFRIFAGSKAFTAVAVVTLALGIGANTAIFSLINAVLLRPLPFRDPDRLMQLFESEPSPGYYPLTGPDYLDWQAQNRTFEATTLFAWNRVANASGTERPESVYVAATQANFFTVLGAVPILGRAFSPGEDQQGKNRVAILNYGFWQQKFGGDPGVVGRTVELDSEAYTIVGVMPRWLKYPRDADMWVPFDMSPKNLGFRGSHSYSALGRLKPGVSVSQAQADLSLIAKRLEQQYPDSNEKIGAIVVPLGELVVRSSREQLLILLGAVALVLLVACANIANLLLSKAAGRQREIAVRAALGASRWRLVRQMLTESVLLSLAGAALGLLAASWGVRVIQAARDLPIPRQNDVRIDLTVLLFTTAISVAVGILFGLVPALHAARLNLSEELKKSAQAAGGSIGARGMLRDVLVVSEIALSLALLVGAGLLLRTFAQMRKVDIGIRSKQILTLELSLPEKRYATLAARREFFDRFLERLGNAPGIAAAAVGTQIPLEGGSNGYISVPGQDDPALKNQLFEWNYVTPDYFRAWGIPLLKGRNFSPEEVNRVAEVNLKINEIFSASNPPKELPKDLSWVAVINNTMARMIWHDEDPIGKVFLTGGFLPVRVVGVVADVKVRGLRGAVLPQGYYPLTGALDHASRSWQVAAKTGVAPMAALGSVRRELSSLDNSLAILNPRTIDDIVSDAMQDTTLQAGLLSAFAALALLLAAIGLYSVMACLVAQRTHEIGIRMALGARGCDVLRLVLGHGSRLILVGVAAGVMGALALTGLIRGLLFGVAANDPLTFVTVAVILIVVALGACAIPAWRAARVDPLIALRWE